MITVIGDCMKDIDLFYAARRTGDGGFPIAEAKPQRVRKGAGGALAVAAMLSWLRAPFQTAHNPHWISRKVRVIADEQVVLRLDRDCRHLCGYEEMRRLLAPLLRPAVVVVVDHGKGMVTPGAWRAILEHASYAPIIVDKAAGQPPLAYLDAAVIKGNEREWGQEPSLPGEGQQYVVTRGIHGLTVMEPGALWSLPACGPSEGDACGAGDMITAVLAAQRLYGIDLRAALTLGVEMAAHVCCHWGAVPPQGVELVKRFWKLAQQATAPAPADLLTA